MLHKSFVKKAARAAGQKLPERMVTNGFLDSTLGPESVHFALAIRAKNGFYTVIYYQKVGSSYQHEPGPFGLSAKEAVHALDDFQISQERISRPIVNVQIDNSEHYVKMAVDFGVAVSDEAVSLYHGSRIKQKLLKRRSQVLPKNPPSKMLVMSNSL